MMPTALFITALPVERRAVRRFVENLTEVQHPHGTIYDVGTYFSGAGSWRVAIAEVGRGNPSTAMEVERAIAHFSPEYAFFVGVAGGLKDVRIGDVVVADKVYGYEFGKAAESFKPRPEFGVPDYTLLQRARALSRAALWTDRIPAMQTALETPRAFVGPIAAGEQVVASTQSETFQLLRDNFSDALAVEMEGYGFFRAIYANRVSAVLIRGISDLLDGKAAADAEGSQDTASINASAFAFTLLSKLPTTPAQMIPPTGQSTKASQSTHRQMLHEMTTREFDAHLREERTIAQRGFSQYSKMFSLCCDFSALPQSTHVFGALLDLVAGSERTEAVEVVGYPGVGKSAFLQLLYWYVYLDSSGRKPSFTPIYLNIHTCNGEESGISSRLATIRHYCLSHPQESYLFILDGADDYVSNKEYIVGEVMKIMKDVPHKKIVAQRIETDSRDQRIERAGDSLFFDRIPVNSAHFVEFLHCFAQLQSLSIEDIGSLEAYLAGSVRECKLQEVDLFVLSLMYVRYQRARPGPIESLTDLLDRHVRNILIEQGVPRGSVEGEINRAAALAFKAHVGAGDGEERGENARLTALVHSHSRISDYLIARYLVFQLVGPWTRVGKKTLDALRYVHPYRINSICKELLNRTTPTQQRALETIRVILRSKSFDPYQKADACYIAGRFKDGQIQSQAREELKRFLRGVDLNRSSFDNEDEERRYLLLVRSCFISLAYLGDGNELYTYLDHLLANSKWDNFNRGFHLEYYGDQPYAASVGLLSNDSSLKPFPLTYDQLYDRVSKKGKNPLFELELHTLYSLAQHRHAAGLLDDEKRTALVDLLSTIVHDRRIGHAGLRRYASVILLHLRQRNFTTGKIALDLLAIKTVKRQGWVRRGIQNCESVADHTIGAMILAAIFLPDRPIDGDMKYDKQRILSMLFVHDLIEARTGDILPWEKTEEALDHEKALYQEFRVYGTYAGVARLDWIDELWAEFETGDSLNAKLAQEIDKLENLFQLGLYSLSHRIDDVEDFEQKLMGQIESSYGERILEIWKQLFRGTDSERQPL